MIGATGVIGPVGATGATGITGATGMSIVESQPYIRLFSSTQLNILLINQSINQKHLLGRLLPMNTGAVQVTQ